MAAPQGVYFDGTNDYLNRGADLTGNADSKLVTGAFWVRFTNATTTSSEVIWATGNVGTNFAITRTTSETLTVSGKNSGGTGILGVNTSAINDTDWHHICFSFDMSDTGKRHLYVDDVSDLTVTTYTNDTIDFTSTEHELGGIFFGSLFSPLDGDIADFWIDYGTYVDLSTVSERRKFIAASAANSVDLGSDGSTPTGTSPLVFFSGATSTWHTNDGTGGGFTENGALTDSSANPPDYAGAGPVSATIEQSLPAVGQTAAGALPALSDIASALPSQNQAATAAFEAAGAIQSVLSPISQEAGSIFEALLLGSSELSPITQSATALAPVDLIGASALPAVTQSAVSIKGAAGETASVLPSVNQAATGVFDGILTGASDLGAVSQSAAAIVGAEAAASSRLGLVTQSADGAFESIMVGSIRLGSIIQAALAGSDYSASAASSLSFLSQRAICFGPGDPDISDTDDLQLPVDFQFAGRPQGHNKDAPLTLRGLSKPDAARRLGRMLKF